MARSAVREEPLPLAGTSPPPASADARRAFAVGWPAAVIDVPLSTDGRGTGILLRMAARDADDVDAVLAQLVDAWCQRRELGALATLLPTYTSNNGLTDGWGDVLHALRMLRARRDLPEEEQRAIARATLAVERAVYRR
jgi:hypothetical protein